MTNGSSLFEIIAYHLFGAKPVSEPMLIHCQLDPEEQTCEISIIIREFPVTKMQLKCRLQNIDHLSRSQCVNRPRILRSKICDSMKTYGSLTKAYDCNNTAIHGY